MNSGKRIDQKRSEKTVIWYFSLRYTLAKQKVVYEKVVRRVHGRMRRFAFLASFATDVDSFCPSCLVFKTYRFVVASKNS